MSSTCQTPTDVEGLRRRGRRCLRRRELKSTSREPTKMADGGEIEAQSRATKCGPTLTAHDQPHFPGLWTQLRRALRAYRSRAPRGRTRRRRHSGRVGDRLGVYVDDIYRVIDHPDGQRVLEQPGLPALRVCRLAALRTTRLFGRASEGLEDAETSLSSRGTGWSRSRTTPTFASCSRSRSHQICTGRAMAHGLGLMDVILDLRHHIHSASS